MLPERSTRWRRPRGLGAVRGWTAPDLAVNLHGSGPQSIDHLLGAAARALLTHRHASHPGLRGRLA